MIFESKIPYPKLEVETKNYAYANLLRKAYASETSEDTAIHMYSTRLSCLPWQDLRM